MVPAKDPLKVKLENFHTSRVAELGEIMCTLVCEGFGFFIIGRVDIINTPILWDPFLVGIPSIRVSHGA